MERIRRPPFYRLSANSHKNCATGCRQNNKEYVKFLNENIYIISSALSINPSQYVIKLNPIHSDNSGCVEGEKTNTNQCICKPTNQIVVDRKFYLMFLHIVNGIPDSYEEISLKKQFSALIILLKFHPPSIVFYLAYMFEINKVSSNLSLFISNGIE